MQRLALKPDAPSVGIAKAQPQELSPTNAGKSSAEVNFVTAEVNGDLQRHQGRTVRVPQNLKAVLLGGQYSGGVEHLVGAGTDAEVAGEIDPADDACGIDEKFGGARDVVAFDPSAFVKHVVAADCFRVGVREKRVGVSGFAAETL